MQVLSLTSNIVTKLILWCRESNWSSEHLRLFSQKSSIC